MDNYEEFKKQIVGIEKYLQNYYNLKKLEIKVSIMLHKSKAGVICYLDGIGKKFLVYIKHIIENKEDIGKLDNKIEYALRFVLKFENTHFWQNQGISVWELMKWIGLHNLRERVYSREHRRLITFIDKEKNILSSLVQERKIEKEALVLEPYILKPLLLK